MKITDLERDLLLSFPKSNYGNAPNWWTWTFEVFTKSGLGPHKGRGVLSSLVKKGLVAMGGEVTSDGESDVYLTDKGIALLVTLE